MVIIIAESKFIEMIACNSGNDLGLFVCFGY